MNHLRIGKLAPRHDVRTLRLANFMARNALPVPPLTLDRASRIPFWGMYGNDILGDCTWAAAAHMIMMDGALEGKVARPSVSTIETGYKKMSPDDQGCVALDVLRLWRKTGIARHKIAAFAALDLGNVSHIKLSASMFGGVYLGVALPQSAQAQVGEGKVWDVPAAGPRGMGAPNTWGGHAVNIVDYNAVGPRVITWGAVQQMTWAFLNTYADEAYAVLSQDWLTAPKTSGIDFPALQAALGQIGKVA
jgi:hypothetical protein